VVVIPLPLSPTLFSNKELEYAEHFAVCSSKTALSFCYTLAQNILQLLKL